MEKYRRKYCVHKATCDHKEYYLPTCIPTYQSEKSQPAACCDFSDSDSWFAVMPASATFARYQSKASRLFLCCLIWIGIRQYALSFSVLERFEQSSTAQKFTITRKLQDYLQIGPQTHTICYDACPPLREITWRDVTSEMGLLVSTSFVGKRS